MLLPVGYCFGLVYYFNRVEEQYPFLALGQSRDLASTKFGLAMVGLLFCIPLLLKFVRFSTSLAALSVPDKAAGSSKRQDDDAGPDPDFDADAMIARYLAGRAEQAEPAPAAAAGPETPARPAPPTFGRRRI
ncbi:MAG: hypothetical protein K2X68_13855 [Novosphingobium sp.]|nr:hypothetical protein [Novosphingobium sp.]